MNINDIATVVLVLGMIMLTIGGFLLAYTIGFFVGGACMIAMAFLMTNSNQKGG